ncbi:hypothetical protein LCGC14_2533470 [marine sediment metagenome]|uniref:Uncharacterized protein n=1 Tax=marine sediment metagenome TaxID=412755 RepID=A0A0F9DKY2_9ZZZZ
MVAAIETMAYEKSQVPWHGIGVPVKSDLSPAQILKAAKLDWTVSKQKMVLQDNPKIVVPDKFALCRDSDNKVLSVVGKVYRPVQNKDAMDFFKKFTAAGHMTMETAGALWDGRYIWGLARVGQDFKLGKDDEVRGFLLLSSPHVHGKAMVIQFTPIRVVCWNTLSMALGVDLKGKGDAFRMPHTQEFNDAMKLRAEEALGLAKEQMIEFREACEVLSKKRAKPEQVEKYFCEVVNFDPKADTVKKKKGKKKGDPDEVKEPRIIPKFREALTHAPGQQLPTALGTFWGAFNAVTYVVDHQLGRARDTALRNAWMGHTANIKRRALTLALKKAA